MTKPTFRQNVAQEMLDQIAKGTAPWQKPWDPNKVRSKPFNPLSEKAYRGMNSIWLESRGYEDPRWLTYKQAQAMGAQVKKGEKSTAIEYWQWTKQEPLLDENGNPKLGEDGKQLQQTVRLTRPRTFRASVFNAEQIEGMPPFIPAPLTFDPLKQAEAILAGVEVPIIHDQSDRCFYTSLKDEIHMVPKEGFETAYNYYSVALHEVGHSTGHSSRLNREMGNFFGSEKYAVEELRAEMASYMLSTELGLGHYPERHAPYIESWMKAIDNDRNVLFQAAAEAEKITEWVLNKDKRLELAKGATMAKEAQEIQKNEGNAALANTRLPDAENEAERLYLNVPYLERKEAKSAGAKWDKDNRAWYIDGEDTSRVMKWVKEPTEPKQEKQEQQSQKERHYLNVPYDERHAAKKAGAKWDRNAKSWYAPDSLNGLEKWVPEQNVKPRPSLSPEEEFKQALEDHGFIIEGVPQMDGKWHRAALQDDKKGKQSGAYRGFNDGIPNGQMKNFKDGEQAHKWVATGARMTEAERIEYRREIELKQQERDAKQLKRQKEVAKIAYGRIQNAREVAPDHPYLKAKGIKPNGLKHHQQTNAILVSLQDTDGFIWSTQAIHENGDKRFQRESRKEGLFHVMGELDLKTAKEFTICEGVATGGTIHEATAKPVIVAFDSGNLKPVAEALHRLNPKADILIAGDNDHAAARKPTQKKNVGVSKAKEAAEAVGGSYTFPSFTKEQKEKKLTDFNDLHQDKGLEAVRKALKPKKERRQRLERAS